jgi:tetratricopeptide (TPR) repeat protein
VKLPAMPAFSGRWTSHLLIALACAACSSPNVTAPDASHNAVPPSVGEQDPATAKEPAAPPKDTPLKDASPRAQQASKGDQDLESGVRNYEEGAYKIAAKQFQSALDAGLDARSDQAKAHKYLAFIACVSGRTKTCRDEFRKALEADPSFDLAPAEAGHPIWGPVFRRVKAETAAKAKAK